MTELLSLRELSKRSGLSTTTLTKYKRAHLRESTSPRGETLFYGLLARAARRRGRRIFFTPVAVDIVRKIKEENG